MEKLKGLSFFKSKKLNNIVSKAEAFADFAAGLTNEELLQEFQSTAKLNLSLALALSREAAFRTLGQKAYPVQLLGAASVLEGCICEMKTGEGKTLTIALAASVLALAEKGVHVATANDYLAERDAEYLTPFYQSLGLSTGLSLPYFSASIRQEAYLKSVTYSTAQQFGFDYLTDNLLFSKDAVKQRSHYAVIVDEADALLIDEAKTPLIISKPAQEGDTLVTASFAFLAKLFIKDEDFEVDYAQEHLALTPEGILKAEEFLKKEDLLTGNLYDSSLIVHHVMTALQAEVFFIKNKDYLVTAAPSMQINLIDSSTGRVLKDRRLQNGLHEALEVKEGIVPKLPATTTASITLQAYFGLYEHLAGMTGTAFSIASELENTYFCPVAVIPTNKPIMRVDKPDLLFPSQEVKLTAFIKKVEKEHATKRPILIGTSSVKESEEVSAALLKVGLVHNVLNAKNHDKEADIIAKAGCLGAITVATNMAGRGVDIKLGGEEIVNYFTPEANYDNTEFLEELYLPKEPFLNPEGEGLFSFEKINKLNANRSAANRSEVFSLGGLLVLGFAKNTSQRVDDQLRGRAGRQGEPGESQFYISLDDELVRFFSDSVPTSLLSSTREAGQPLTNKLLNKFIVSAQHKAEVFDEDSRLEVIKYDKVYNLQLQEYYTWREKVLETLSLEDLFLPWLDAAYTMLFDEWSFSSPSSKDFSSFVSDFIPAGLLPNDLLKESITDIGILVSQTLASALQRFSVGDNDEYVLKALQSTFLQLMDLAWAQHITQLRFLQDSVSFRAHASQRPEVAFSEEAEKLFKNTVLKGLKASLRFLWSVEVSVSITDLNETPLVAKEKVLPKE